MGKINPNCDITISRKGAAGSACWFRVYLCTHEDWSGWMASTKKAWKAARHRAKMIRCNICRL